MGGGGNSPSHFMSWKLEIMPRHDGTLARGSPLGMCYHKGYGFAAGLVINWVLILAILIILRGSVFCSLVLNWACCLKEATFSSLMITLV